MPITLEASEFTAANLAQVDGFYCGEERFAKKMAKWIQTESVATIQEFGNRVWLYSKPTGELVGFGSVGTTKWTVNGVDFELAIIPAFGVQHQYRQQPPGDRSQRFSHQILRDLIAKAKQLGVPLLGLYVYPKNIGAIKLYEEFGFVFVNLHSNGYNRMLLRIA